MGVMVVVPKGTLLSQVGLSKLDLYISNRFFKSFDRKTIQLLSLSDWNEKKEINTVMWGCRQDREEFRIRPST